MRLDFSKGKVLVVGDLMLDRYCIGSVSRISPEAPIPVVKVARNHATLGGARNVANNLAHLHANVDLVGPLGNDESGRLVNRMCRENRITLSSLQAVYPTITKTRIIGERQQIVRIDFEEGFRWTGDLAGRVRATVKKRIRAARVVVISDYGKGFCSPDLCRFIISEARKSGKPVIADPKGHDWDKYRGAAVITPNVKELSEIAGAPIVNSDGQVESYGKKARSAYKIQAILVTRSEKGMTLVAEKSVEHVPTVAREVFDVSGAGDTVVATLAAALASGYSMHEAIGFANKAAGIVVGKIGTVPVEIEELAAAVDGSAHPKLLEKAELIRRIGGMRHQGKKIVFTNGCFDILHRGNVHVLDQAKRQGDILVVALNSDTSASHQKGRGALINGELDRAHLVGAIDSVDYVTIFGEKTPLDLIRKIRPDVIVKGGNYAKNEVLGRERAGRVVIVPQLEGYSTKEIARKISGKT
jgi:D-beta-D-heptose 7-phosphate kinase/D-beta-D-heptose 1-phosphate adenosyltransferase